MKKIIFALTLVLATSIVSFAQNMTNADMETKTPEQKAEWKTEKLSSDLSLTADQKAKVKKIILQKEKEAEALKSKNAGSTDDAAKKASWEKLKASKDAEMQKVLTNDQYTKYKTLQAQYKEEWKSKKESGKM